MNWPHASKNTTDIALVITSDWDRHVVKLETI